MAVMRVVGLDVSIASTGVAVLAWVEGKYSINTFTVPTAKLAEGSADLQRRFDYLADYLAPYIRQASLIVIEGPAFRSVTAQAHALAGAWWSCYRKAERSGIPTLEIPPSVLKRYATGKGNADKAVVATGVARMWPDYDCGDNNQIDALGLASIGAHAIGLEVPYSVTQDRQKLIEKHANICTERR